METDYASLITANFSFGRILSLGPDSLLMIQLNERVVHETRARGRPFYGRFHEVLRDPVRTNGVTADVYSHVRN